MSVLSVVEQIIHLGKVNDWFIPLDLVSESDYIYAKNGEIIIDTSGLKLFLDDNSTLTKEQLKDYLIEFIEGTIEASNYYKMVVIIKDSYL